VLALLGGLATTLWQADKARSDARRAEAVQTFLTNVLTLNDPQQAQGRDLSARESLDIAARQIDAEFKGQPDVQVKLHHLVGTIFIELGAMAPAAEHLRSALELREHTRLVFDDKAVETLLRLGQAQVELRDFDTATKTLARALLAGDALGKVPHRWTGRVMAYQAWIASQQGQLDRSAALGDEALRVQRQVSGERSADYLTVASTVASNHLARGQLAAAEPLLVMIDQYGPELHDYPITDQLGNRYSLASLRFNQGEYVLAEQSLRQIVPLFDKHIGPLHDRTAIARALFARSLAELGRYDEAVREQAANVANISARSKAEPEALNLARLQLVRLLTLAGRFPESVAMAHEVVNFFDARYPEPTRYREAARWYLGEALLGSGLRVEGVRELQASLSNAEKMGKANNPLERAGKWLSLAVALREKVSLASATRHATDACTLYAAALGAANQRVLKCLAVQTWLEALQATPANRLAAREAFVSARSKVLAITPAQHPLRAELLAAEAEILRASGNDKQAAPLQAQARDLYQQLTGQNLPAGFLLVH
jgi:eukaryotic-like serine/threonine-protein kinase